ncbi:hypothetical protein ACFOYU_22570 [Microvirga sp. GCM10011540]|uniref:hypothetical protein n=1 Tax=Microvirga sp. GCM10011540 TaxID=3317338 RepID=UPI0036086871
MTARVLIVGTVFVRTQALQKTLLGAGFDAVIATNRRDGLALCRRGMADVVLLDAVQPGLDAFAFCRKLKGEGTLRHLPLGLAMRDGEPRLRLQALETQVDECFPVSMPDRLFLLRMHSLAELSERTGNLRRMAVIGGQDVPPAAAGRARILVLDPEVRSRQRLEEILAPEFPVTTASHAEEALAAVTREAFGVIACDFTALREEGLAAALLRQHLRLGGMAGAFGLIGLGDDAGAVYAEAPEGALHDVLLRPLDRCETLLRVRLGSRKHILGTSLKALAARLESCPRLAWSGVPLPPNHLAA